jgi:hypothetical protein
LQPPTSSYFQSVSLSQKNRSAAQTVIRDRPSDPYNFIADQRLGGHITGMWKSGIVGKWALPSGISNIF